jgi:hypothetical protein
MLCDDCATISPCCVDKLHGCAVSCCCCHCLQHKPPPPGGPWKSAGMSKAVRHALDSLGLIFARLPAQVGGLRLTCARLACVDVCWCIRLVLCVHTRLQGNRNPWSHCVSCAAAVRQGCRHGSWLLLGFYICRVGPGQLLAAHAWPALVRLNLSRVFTAPPACAWASVCAAPSHGFIPFGSPMSSWCLLRCSRLNTPCNPSSFFL